MKEQLIASSATEEGLVKLINKFYYSENYILKDNQAYNTRLEIYRGRVEVKKGRYKFYV